MLAGLPVIATRIGALVELIRQKQLLCEPKDPLELAKRIDFVLSHKRFAEKTIAKNRAFALGAFSEEKITKRLVKTYFKVLGE
jgi:glycosyltransferase involved in cell wall biosynthesis